MRSSGSGAAISTTFSSSSVASSGGKIDEIVTYNISNLTISMHNTLINYLHLDQGNGVILAPHQHTDSTGQLRKILIDNFKNAVQIIHATLRCCTTHRMNVRSSSSGLENNPWINKSLVAVKEQVGSYYYHISIVNYVNLLDPLKSSNFDPRKYFRDSPIDV